MLAQVVLAFAYDAILLDEKITPLAVTGALLIGVGVVMVGCAKEQIKRRTQSSFPLLGDEDAASAEESLANHRGSLDGM